MRRVLFISTLAAALLVPATAQAAFQVGSYRGTTTQGRPISFTIQRQVLVRPGPDLVRFQIRFLRLSFLDACPDGRTIPVVLPPLRGPFINKLTGTFFRRFTLFGVTQPTVISGRVVNKTATGYVSDVTRSQGVFCRSGNVPFTARKP
jgi:hypothetical protein